MGIAYISRRILTRGVLLHGTGALPSSPRGAAALVTENTMCPVKLCSLRLFASAHESKKKGKNKIVHPKFIFFSTIQELFVCPGSSRWRRGARSLCANRNGAADTQSLWSVLSRRRRGSKGGRWCVCVGRGGGGRIMQVSHNYGAFTQRDTRQKRWLRI